MLTLTQIEFCAAECERQKSGELSVGWMCDAYHYALNFNVNSVRSIEILGTMVEPKVNHYGFRTTPVYFDNDRTRQAIPAHGIERALTSLVEHRESITAEHAYIEFQKIHPFNDGNGRVGAILYNFWLGKLDKPVKPPIYK